MSVLSMSYFVVFAQFLTCGTHPETGLSATQSVSHPPPSSSSSTNMEHPFRPPVQPPPPSRSTETPMDFTYDKSSASSSCLSSNERPKSMIRPLVVIDQNGNHRVGVEGRNNLLSSQSHEQLRTIDNKTSTPWFASLRPSAEPPRKRLHCETESMDWETCPPEPKPKSFPSSNPTSTTTTKQLSLPTPPVYTAPSSSLTSPQKIGPASYGLQQRPGSVYRDDQEADSSVDIDQLVLQPAGPSYMYSNQSPAKHENRRRTRAQKQLRSKLGSFSLNSDNEEDSDVEVVSSQHRNLVVKQPKGSRKRLDRTKSDPVTTNNYLTINGWKGPDGVQQQQQQQSPSRLSTDTPYILLVYLQLLFNSSLVFVGLYLAINLILIIRTDINHKVLVHTNRLRQEIELCTKEYHSNRCYPVNQRTQFIEKHCIQWEECMARNPNLISRSKIGAETFAEVMNGFVDVISWKTMLFIFLSIGAGIYATNLAMNNYKSKWEPPNHHHHHRHHPHPKPSSSSSSWAPRLNQQTDDPHHHTDNQALDPIAVFARDQKK
ncbi:hypothetical protein PGT21_019905 [Puccinia graminis f. sp. tritici]|uniref:Brl1/Brr6 domain-containing protein n=1 Tax=Puccinia graminis f. sp. tritici TaxID=56615 RepID=A0A5B0M4A3_PUCGR|nr:hypothetical protein PGTUg99_009590 [Puccinia graminis f. sp. tritici]KAA1094388.1 hypothetical protein PGT21_019905 [Puccinia graminis f. sp. tritici]